MLILFKKIVQVGTIFAVSSITTNIITPRVLYTFKPNEASCMWLTTSYVSGYQFLWGATGLSRFRYE